MLLEKRRDLSSKIIEVFEKLLRQVNLTHVTTLHNVNHAYNRFQEIFSGIYDLAIPKRKPKIQKKTLNSLCITKGLKVN